MCRVQLLEGVHSGLSLISLVSSARSRLIGQLRKAVNSGKFTKLLHGGIVEERLHLCACYLIELRQSYGGGYSLTNKNTIDAFEIGKDHKLLKCSIITYVAFVFGMCVPPFACSLSEEGDIEEVRLRRIFEVGLFASDLWRQQDILDGIGVDAVVDFGQCALECPIELQTVILIGFESLKLAYHVVFKFGTEP